MESNDPNTGKNQTQQEQDYGAESIKVLKGLDAVRKRPGMYIGDTDDGSGLHHMVYEVVDNAIDEALAGYCDSVEISLNSDGSVSVTDNGRGIPVDIHAEEGISAAEVIMTQLHAGGKFDQNSYKVSGGLHGVGVSVVNALSDWLELTIWRGGKEYFIKFIRGVAEAPLKMIKDAPEGKRGTSIKFKPSTDTFTNVEFNFSTLEYRLRELAFLNSGVRIVLKDLRTDEHREVEFLFEGGIIAYINYLDRSKTALHSPISIFLADNDSGISVEIAMQWTDSYHENILCFTNNIRQKEGGTHLIGFKSALTRVVTNYINDNGLNKKSKINFSGDDAREGLSCILSVKVPDPKFSSQTKDKLVSSEVRPVVENTVSNKLLEWLEEHPTEAKLIVNKALEAAAAKEAARKARELVRKKSSLEISSILSKIARCQSNKPEECELFIVEGDSAGGTAKQGRDRRVQAILPLRGKILNVERARFDKILGSEQVGTLIAALGTSIGNDEFDIGKLKYHKIVIMTDADVDGSHIRTLLLTFFYRHMPELIRRGHLFIAQPPLYKLKKGSSETYLKNTQALNQLLVKQAVKESILKIGDKVFESDELYDLVVELMKFINFVHHFSKKLDPTITECVALSELSNFLNDSIKLSSELQNILSKLNHTHISLETTKWSADVSDGNIEFSRLNRGIKEAHTFSFKIIEELGIYKNIQALFKGSFEYTHRNNSFKLHVPSELVNMILEDSKRNISIQRFKGLGEMNSEQLWETTLNPLNRTLLQVKIQNESETEELVSILMGDVVEPRKEFIQQNALNVINLDI